MSCCCDPADLPLCSSTVKTRGRTSPSAFQSSAVWGYPPESARRHLHRFYVARGQPQRAAAYREPA